MVQYRQCNHRSVGRTGARKPAAALSYDEAHNY